MEESAMALFLFMDLVATAAKTGDPLAVPFLEAEAIQVMPDGVVIYRRDRFAKVMSEMISKM